MQQPPRDSQTSGFDELVRPHLDRLYRLSFRLTRTVDEAEDLLQDVLCKVFERRDELSSITDLGPWLSRVLYNQFVDASRRDKRRRLRVVAEHELTSGAVVDSFAHPGPDAQAAAVTRCDIEHVRAALDELSDEHRSVILMHDVEGYKLEEIRLITGVPTGTLKSRLSRARARLREIVNFDGTF